MNANRTCVWNITAFVTIIALLFSSVSPVFAQIDTRKESHKAEDSYLETIVQEKDLSLDLEGFAYHTNIGAPDGVKVAEQSSNSQNLEEENTQVAEEYLSLTMRSVPRLLVPGKPVMVTWDLKGLKLLEGKQNVTIQFDIPKGLALATEIKDAREIQLASADSRQFVLDYAVANASGTLNFSFDEKILTGTTAADDSKPPYTVMISVKSGEKVLASNAVLLDVGHSTVEKATGGKASSPDGRITVEVPASAITEDLFMEIRDPEPASNPGYSLSGRPAEILAVGHESKQDINKFQDDIAVTIRYQEDQIFGWAEADLEIYYFDEVTYDWYPVPTVIDEVNNTLTARVNHLTVFDFRASSWQSYSLPNVDAFSVSDFNGAGTYSINLWTPPGPGGLQPSLALNYNSQVIDESTAYTQASWVGMGWSLDTGYIERDWHGTNEDVLDDTYRLNVNGISSRLLPVETNTADITTFMTEDQTYMKIIWDRTLIPGTQSKYNRWFAYDKEGNKYLFDFKSITHTTNGCVTSEGGLERVWRWSLSSITNKNNQAINYTYVNQAKSTTCKNHVAVYPVKITYPNGKYEILFNLEARTDFQTAWKNNTSKVFFQKSRLKNIQVINNSPAAGTIIRQYVFSYSPDTANQILPNFIWSEGGRTSTLISIQEKNGAGNASLPATTFTYGDKQHLTKVDNGQGGSVTLDYDRWHTVDDYNDLFRSLYTEFGVSGSECYGSNGTSWTVYENYGTVKCEASMLQIYKSTGVGIGVRSIPQHLIKPGGRYRMFLKARAIDGTTDIEYGFRDTVSGDDSQLRMDNVTTTATEKDASLEMYTSFHPQNSKFIIECSDCYIKKLQFMLMPSWFRVKTRTITDGVTGNSTVYTYQYDEPSANDHDNSDRVPSSVRADISKLYTPPIREFRGHAMTRVINPENLVTTSWYYQNDTLKGRAYRSLISSNDYYEGFSANLPADTAWTFSGAGNEPGLANDYYLISTNTGTNWDVSAERSVNSLTDGNVVYLKFRLDSKKPDTNAEMGVATDSGDFFGVVVANNGTNHDVKMRIRNAGNLTDIDGTTLLTIPDANLDEWYWLMFFIDNTGDFRVSVWQEDAPEVVAQDSYDRNGAVNWHYLARVNNGILCTDAYHEGHPYSMALTNYTAIIQYDTDEGTTIPALSYNDLNTKFNDLQVVWRYANSQTSWNFEGDSTFTSTRTDFEYNAGDQGGTQYGNLTRTTESYWEAGQYKPYRASRTQYWPVSPALSSGVMSGLLLNLPGRQTTLACSNTCDFVTEAAKEAEVVYLYDGSQVYNAQPSLGKLTAQRNWVSGNNYSQVSYGYDNYGNLTSQTAYTGFAAINATPGSGSQTTVTEYETTYNTYAVLTRNALGHETNTGYNFNVGQPTSVTDPNGAVTTAEYDDFGRQTKIIAPGDSSSAPTLQIEYVNYASASAPFHVNLNQRVDANASIRISRFYNGLGSEIQTQTIGSVIGGAKKTTVTDKQYNTLGRLVKQTVPYEITYNPTPTFSAQTFSQAYTQTTYDLLGRVLTSTPPNGNDIAYAYDDLTVSVTDPKNNITVTASDVWGRTVKVDAADGPDLVYTYNVMDRLLTTTKGSGTSATAVSIAYNRAGQKTAMDDPDLGAWSYTYDALGNLLTQTDARGCVTGMTYDVLNRVTGKTYSGPGACAATGAVSYYYDEQTFSFLGSSYGGAGSNKKGRLTGMIDGSGATLYTYDNRGRTTEQTKKIYQGTDTLAAESFTTHFTYNSADLPIKMTLPDNEELTYGYDEQGSLKTLTGNAGTGYTYVKDAWYDTAGRMTRLKLGDVTGNPVIIKAYSYYDWSTAIHGGMLQSLVSTNSSNVQLQNLAYSYDRNANITSIVNTAGGETSSYAYDVLNRLTSGIVKDSSNNTVLNENFTYNPQTGSMSAKNGQNFSYDIGNHDHAVTAYGGNGYTYDANGNQITRDLGNENLQLIYDAENRLIEVTSNQPFPAEDVNWEGVTRTPTATITETPTATPTASATLPASETPTVTLEATVPPAATDTPEPTPTVPTETPTETAIPTETPTLDPSITVTEETPLETETPAPTMTETPTETATSEGTPTDTETPAPTGTGTAAGTATETATAKPTETPTSVPVQGGVAKYYYDGNGSMVKSVIGDVVTYYGSPAYQVKTDGTHTNTRKYYAFGNSSIAMRENDVLTWLMNDQINSTTVTASENGTLASEIRYTAFGETRWVNGVTVTDQRYTGQREEAEIGLYYYVARWYDPVLAHFLQADTVVPYAAFALSYDRYAYADQNPIRYNDPSGHMRLAEATYTWTVNDYIYSSMYRFNWYFAGMKTNRNQGNTSTMFTKQELKTIYQTGRDISAYVEKKEATSGGDQWIRKNLGGTTFHKGGLPHQLVSKINGGPTSCVTNSDVWLTPTFMMDVNSRQHIAHELTHVLDNHTAPNAHALWNGGGAADSLTRYVGGDPRGIRFCNGERGIPYEYSWAYRVDNPLSNAKNPRGDYGDRASAEYFAEAFSWSIYNTRFLPGPAGEIQSWVDALIIDLGD